MTTEPVLKDKVALVVGAAGGICRAVALTFAEAGAHVVCADMDETAPGPRPRPWRRPGGGRSRSAST